MNTSSASSAAVPGNAMPVKAVTAATIGTALEWFDFALSSPSPHSGMLYLWRCYFWGQKREATI